MEKLYTQADLATRWDVSRQLVNNWRTRHIKTFPDPVQYVSNGKIALYKESDVMKYEEGEEFNAKK
ncbi:TPA: hypothetical protein QCN93_004746 [Bacillus pacificus]|nr:hypothetical protein [Bacillus pacificus]